MRSERVGEPFSASGKVARRLIWTLKTSLTTTWYYLTSLLVRHASADKSVWNNSAGLMEHEVKWTLILLAVTWCFRPRTHPPEYQSSPTRAWRHVDADMTSYGRSSPTQQMSHKNVDRRDVDTSLILTSNLRRREKDKRSNFARWSTKCRYRYRQRIYVVGRSPIQKLLMTVKHCIALNSFLMSRNWDWDVAQGKSRANGISPHTYVGQVMTSIIDVISISLQGAGHPINGAIM